jgi:hypothetical protein
MGLGDMTVLLVRSRTSRGTIDRRLAEAAAGEIRLSRHCHLTQLRHRRPIPIHCNRL